MQFNKILFITLIAILILCSCIFTPKSTHQELRDEYEHIRLFVPHIFLKDIETASLNRFPESHWDFTDSITKMLINELNDLDIQIEFNKPLKNTWSDSIWTKKPKSYYYLSYKRLNEKFILSTVDYNEKPQLIPFLIYRHVHKSNPQGGNHHNATAHLRVYIVEKGNLIYSNTAFSNTKSIFYVYEHDLDKSLIDTKEMWKSLVQNAMKDYIENLK